MQTTQLDATRKLKSLTIVAPFYNEAAGVAAFYGVLTAVLRPLSLECRFVFVDDGSSDDTLYLLDDLAQQDHRVTVLGLARNFGHQVALTAGLDFATAGDAVVVMDSDLQHPPGLIPRMIAAYEQGFDVVYAARRRDENLGAFKRFTSRLYYRLMRVSANVELVPGAADFRLMAQPAAAYLREMRETHRFLRGMVPWLGFDFTVLHYDQPQRQSGQSSYTLRKMLRLARHGVFSFSTLPLDVITWLGFITTGLAFIYLIYVLIAAAVGATVPGWTSVIGVLLFLGGIQLISLGVIAQYVGMIFEQSKQRPLYTLRHVRRASADDDKNRPRIKNASER